MKYLSLVFLLSLTFCTAFGQSPSFIFTKEEVEQNLRYIASDELEGRRTASKGEKLAAEFIVKAFEKYGVKPVPGQTDYYQKIPFVNIQPPKDAKLTIGENEFQYGDNLLIINGLEINQTAEVVFAGHGWLDEKEGLDDYKGLDVKGKIVVTVIGLPSGNSPNEVFASISKKRELAAEHGAVALIEIYRMALPWSFTKSYFNKERLQLDEDADGKSKIAYGWVQEVGTPNLGRGLNEQKTTGQIQIVAGAKIPLFANNIIGFIEGTDPMLRNEYLVLSAHYDHVGVGKEGNAPFSPIDSIFNGARDNGIGTVALLAAAKDLAKNPLKRSVVLLACTAEEIGLLGSEWFVNHPTIDLNKAVFNLNTDGAGYNSTSCFTVIGKGLTNADEELEKAGASLGLKFLDDPAPEQGLYERSDNFSFANKGIPSIDFAPCITEMGQEIFKYYHQAADNPDTLDYDYILKFCQSYTQAAKLIGNKTGAIEWTEMGSKYKKK